LNFYANQKRTSKHKKENVLDSPISKENGWTLLHESTFNGHFSIAKLLLDAGATPNVATVDGTLPFHNFVTHNIAEQCKLQSTEEFPVEMDGLAMRLTMNYTLLNAENKFGETPAHYACLSKRDSTSALKYLINRGANLTIPTKCDFLLLLLLLLFLLLRTLPHFFFFFFFFFSFFAFLFLFFILTSSFSTNRKKVTPLEIALRKKMKGLVELLLFEGGVSVEKQHFQMVSSDPVLLKVLTDYVDGHRR